ncbi:hypothetical protein A7P98_09245 [Eikenella sp. NML080894]|uniref:hypothetical protein n=1 Tax=Eikenella TaxID=538 RepID=UPI0007DEE650|nr:MULTISPECIES: hypothetical protein [Eikenella]OAM35095.1 hypothetical protein A7P98_09245 [Eikenella sp. NML080894]OAM37403.1 hypothetical protein A7P99_08130 [Eikenella sp. NML120348]OAM45275.1 hypothetical protein A7Q03_04985 [Eikenella sp. NML99-0057]
MKLKLVEQFSGSLNFMMETLKEKIMYSNQKRLLAALLGVTVLFACTSITVQPVSAAEDIREICIENNPRVQVRDFVSVLQNRLAYHNIQSQVVEDKSA